MANYQYDEGGNMAAYFLITFLAIILIPLTFSMSTSKRQVIHDGCECQLCVEQRVRIQKREQGPFLNLLSPKAGLVIIGWLLLFFITYKAARAKVEHKVYDPFEVLGLKSSASEKEIKSHYKRMSKLFHPDKVKPTANQTIEAIANKFVEITKAYKSLTDETIRKNWQLYGHPDGRQETTVGIALPIWVIKGKNNVWVLGFYGVVFGVALPVLVGRWWFGNRQKTKDGIHSLTAATFFKSVTEESDMNEVVGALGRVFEWEGRPLQTDVDELSELDGKMNQILGQQWREVKTLAGIHENETSKGVQGTRRALILLYAHLLRIPVTKPALQAEQTEVLLQTPVLLSAFLTITTARNWLPPTLAIMRLHAYLTQAIPLTHSAPYHRLAQLPGIQTDEARDFVSGTPTEQFGLEEFVSVLETRKDVRANEVRKAMRAWGKLEVVDASFKVIGERIVTPSAIVYLVVKLRIKPPMTDTETSKDQDPREREQISKENEAKDYKFLTGRTDAEDFQESGGGPPRWIHAPYWPENRKPTWWLVLADDKTNRVVVPPLKITDIPCFDPRSRRNYRSYKLQFQAPQGVGLFTWKVCLISDAFVGEDVCQDLALKIDDLSSLNADEQVSEDEISEPEEDTLAGQMAMMRGGTVKKRRGDDDDSDEESGTDDEEGNESSSSSSDSDSDSD